MSVSVARFLQGLTVRANVLLNYLDKSIFRLFNSPGAGSPSYNGLDDGDEFCGT